MLENLKEEICLANQQLPSSGLVKLTWGNVSGIDKDKGILVLEINTIPGLTNLSDLPAQAKAANIDFDTLIEIILNSAR